MHSTLGFPSRSQIIRDFSRAFLDEQLEPYTNSEPIPPASQNTGEYIIPSLSACFFSKLLQLLWKRLKLIRRAMQLFCQDLRLVSLALLQGL